MKLSDLTEAKKIPEPISVYGIGVNEILDLEVSEEKLKEIIKARGYLCREDIDEMKLHNCICGNISHSIDDCEQAGKIVDYILKHFNTLGKD